MRRIRTAGLVMIMSLGACNDDNGVAPLPLPLATVVMATGDLTAAVATFRDALGPANGTVAGEQANGRREISWDGASANPFNNQDNFPAAFFNTVANVGSVFVTNGTGFRNDSTRFVDINATYAAEFGFLSPNKIFAPIGSNRFDQLFQVAGQPTPALVTGVGIVFSDVDVKDSTTVQLFALDGTSLGVYAAPVRTDATGLSFVGISYADALIARVRITLGTGALGVGVNDLSAGGTRDLVVVDNMIYGEPRHAF